MTGSRHHRMIGWATTALVLGVLLGAPAPARADIEEIVLRVDGLACPFCAYGLEKKLGRVSGVDQVDVQMDAGRVILTPSRGTVVSVDTVERAVSDAGFSLRSTELTATGRLGERGGALVLWLDGPSGAAIELVGGEVPDDEFARRVGDASVRVSGRLQTIRQEAGRIVFVLTVDRYERVQPA